MKINYFYLRIEKSEKEVRVNRIIKAKKYAKQDSMGLST